jgi:pilus assembly protein TadC
MDASKFFIMLVGKFVNKDKIIRFERKLCMNNSKMKNLNDFAKWCTIEGIFSMIAAMLAYNQFSKAMQIDTLLIIGAMGFLAPFALNYLFEDIKFEKRKRAKEELLSDVLLEASIFCDESSANENIKKLANQDFPLIGDDFKRAFNEINNGASPEEALTHLKELNQSKEYSRVMDIFLQGYKSGARISDILKETAEDLLEAKAIIKERQAVMLVTKYTLLLASGIIVPAILGLIIGLVTGLNFDSLGELSFGISTEQRKIIFQTAISGTTIYILEYAALSSFFLALQEGNKKNFWIYAGILIPIASATFFIAKTL